MAERNLGNEWLGWRNKFKMPDVNADTQKRVYFSIFFLALLIFGAFLGFVFYLILPRLSQFFYWLPYIVGSVFLAVWLILFIWYFLILITVLTGWKIGQLQIKMKHLMLKSFPWVFRLGLKIGLNRDRLSNSIIKVSNAIIGINRDPILPKQLMVLLPRCLKKELIDNIKTYSFSKGIQVFIVSGGSKAREIISKEHPKGIIGVACERDLLSGINEILPQIPVIGIPNIRPEGPCKNTMIAMDDFIVATQCFLGKL